MDISINSLLKAQSVGQAQLDFGLPALASGEALAHAAVAHAVNYPNAPVIPETLFLLEEVADIDNLRLAFKRVKANKGAPGFDRVSVNMVAADPERILTELSQKLLAEKYSPSPVRRVAIPKPDGSSRNLGIPIVIDRIVQQAILQILDPIIDPTFSDSSFGFRKGRSTKDALKAAQQHIDDGYDVTISIDLRKCFDNINHDLLFNALRKHLSDRRVLLIIGKFLRAGIWEKGITTPSDKGTPQGGPLSPLLANIFLDAVDKLLEQRGHRFVRYADDLTIFVQSPRSAQRVFDNITKFFEKKLKLEVNKAKSEINTNYTFILGFLLRCDNLLFIPAKKIAAFKAKIKAITRRQCGKSLAQVIHLINPLLRGWFHYFKLAQAKRLFRELDGWIKRRLRAIFLKQCKRKRTRFKRLSQRKIHPALVRAVAFSSKGIWRLARTGTLHTALNDQFFSQNNLFSLSVAYQAYAKSQA